MDGSIIPCFEDDFVIDGSPISQNMSFEEWKKRFVKDIGLTNGGDGGIIKSIGDLKINSQPHDILSDLRDTNPNYSKGGSYQTNCGYCAVTYELRRRGFDVEVRPSSGSAGSEILSMFKNFIAMKPSGNTKELVVRDLIETALSWGNNARGLVCVQWKSADSRHYFSIEVHNNKVVFVDPQSAMQDVSNYFDKIHIDRILFGRVDNLELSETVINAVVNRR